MTVELLPRPAPPGTKPLLIARGDLSLPLVGNWSAHLTMAEAQLAQMPSGNVTLRWLGQDLPGHVERVGDNASIVSLLIVGGNGGLGQLVQPRPYNAAVSTVLRRLLDEVGEEAAAADSDAGALGKQLDRWPQIASEASEVLDELARGTGRVWQMQPSTGRVWLGLHAFAPAPTDGLIEETRDPAWELVQLALTQFGPQPGQTYEGRRIGHATYSVTPERAGLKLWLLPDNAPQDLEADPLKYNLAWIVREVLRSDPRAAIPWAATYTGRVVMQRADGSVDVTPHNRAIPTLNKCRVGVPVPGAKLTLQADDVVRLAFDEMDPLRPRAELYEQGEGTKAVARVGDKTVPHTHTVTFDLTAPPGGGAVTGTITLATADPAIAEGSPRISLS